MPAESDARPGLGARLRGFVDRTRERVGWLDHAVRTQEGYSRAKGTMQAGAITYFGFLSFFPVLALAFFAVGYVARVFPEAEENLVAALNDVLPGIIGTGAGQLALSDIERVAGTLGLIGLAGALYSGLGWLSAMRTSLLAVFELPENAQPSFVIGKLRDLLTLAVVGVTLVASVAISSLVTGYSEDLLEWIGLDVGLEPLLWVLSITLGLAASSALFFLMFTLLARPRTPRRSLWGGALLGAVGFELLKQLSSYLLVQTKGQPAFQAFGVALILVVWINYFSRVVLYAAAWADSSPRTRAAREAVAAGEAGEVGEVVDPADSPEAPRRRTRVGAGRRGPTSRPRAFLTGAGTGAGIGAVAGALAVLRKRRNADPS